MPLRWRLIVTVLVIAALIAAVAVRAHRETLRRQWFSYRAGAAGSYAEAEAQMAWFEQAPDAEDRIRELVGYWGAGNPRFDFYLARYVREAQSTEALRHAFSLELAWRDGLLARWARYWCWRSPMEPDEQVASAVDYFTMLADVHPPRPITWREVLDLQAVFQLTGQPRLALRLTPDNWRERFARWQAARPAAPPRLARPTAPFADWEGPLPE